MIINLVARGYTAERIVDAYPQLTKQDIRDALSYAESLADRERVTFLSRVTDQTVEAINEILGRLLASPLLAEKEAQKSLMMVDETRVRVRLR